MENETVLIQTPDDPAAKKRGIVGFCFAVLCFAAAYLLLCIVPIGFSPIGYFILTAAFFAITLAAALLTGARIRKWSLVFMIFGLIAAFYGVTHGSIDFTINDNGFYGDIFPFFAFVFSGAFYSLFVLSLYGNASGSVGGGLLLDLVKSVCYLFISFPEFFNSLFKPEGSKKHKHTLLFIVVGAVIAAILVLIVVGLLSFDKHFSALLPNLDIDDIGECFLKTFFAVPLSAMVFSIYASSRAGKLPRLSTEESSAKVGSSVRVIPTPVIVIPVTAILAVYVLFFVSQWAYYLSAFTHSLPEGYSAAEYAREGFFQLCAVAAINTLLIIVLSCFNKRSGREGVILESVMKILLSVASLILIATAVSKMLLYIDLYDLTRMRLNVTLFLFFLAAAFVFVILSSIIKRFKAIPAIIITGALMLAGLALVNTNSIIADYNVNAYLSGKHENVDVEYLSEGLGYSSVPALKKLYENAPNEKIKKEAKSALMNAKNLLESGNKPEHWYDHSIPSIRAKRILKDQ